LRFHLLSDEWVEDLESPYFSSDARSGDQLGTQLALAYAYAFRWAQRAFIIADNFFRMAALIGLRPACFFGVALAFFGADLPFHFAQRCFIAAEIRLRAAALIR
jgi:hypothetical protein